MYYVTLRLYSGHVQLHHLTEVGIIVVFFVS